MARCLFTHRDNFTFNLTLLSWIYHKKRLLDILVLRWKGGIKINFEETVSEDGKWTELPKNVPMLCHIMLCYMTRGNFYSS
jgi:hypothetical protein